ncbi:MAG: flavoprotein [Candidatus Bipolaricaulota bacterium]
MSNSELLNDRRITLGVCGVSTAYKGVILVEKMKELGAEVRVILNKEAQKFVTPLTFERVSGHDVIAGSPESAWNSDEPESGVPSIESELTVVIPASFNFIGKLASGLGKDFLTQFTSNSDNPVLLAPSMNRDLYSSQIAQSQLKKLRKQGFYLLEPKPWNPEKQISKDFPLIPDLDKVISKIREVFRENQLLQGKKILVISPPTRDPFTTTSHLKTGSEESLGYRISEKAKQMGGEVLLASGPTEQITPSGVGVVWIKTVNELDDLLTTEAPDYDLILMVGSASDWGPMAGSDLTEEEKTKKFDLDIPEIPDLGRKLGRLKSEDQVLIEFSTVLEREKSETLERLKVNNIDGIFSPLGSKEQQEKGDQASGFLLFSSGEVQGVHARGKSHLASGILNQLAENFYKED